MAWKVISRIKSLFFWPTFKMKDSAPGFPVDGPIRSTKLSFVPGGIEETAQDFACVPPSTPSTPAPVFSGSLKPRPSIFPLPMTIELPPLPKLSASAQA